MKFPNSTIGQIKLYFQEFNISIYSNGNYDTAKIKLDGEYKGDSLFIYFKDKRGESYFELYSKSKLKMTGYYSNAIDTLSKYIISKSLGIPGNKKIFHVQKLMYQTPLPSGIWTFYNLKTKKITKQEYEYIID